MSEAGQSPAGAPLKANGTPFESLVLLLQGGGALGAYQAGVYETLLARGLEPNWIAGISIGAINSALIAGNPRERRISALRDFWELVSDPSDGGWVECWSKFLVGDVMRAWVNQLAAGQILAHGVPGFFTPRVPPPNLALPGGPEATSWYDTSALRPTLERLVDFDRINAKAMRFSVGAVNVRTGNFAYFDNETDTIRPEHIMASGALPPAFPAVEVDGEFYWDGGLVSNTPLDWVFAREPGVDTLIFQIDLWSARGELPRDLSEVAVRTKEIQFSSRTRAATDGFRRFQRLRAEFHDLLAQLPQMTGRPYADLLARLSSPAVCNIIQLIYRSQAYESHSKDYEFSRQTMEEHWAAGRRDALTSLERPDTLQLPRGPHAVEVFDVNNPLTQAETVQHEPPGEDRPDHRSRQRRRPGDRPRPS